MLLWQQSKSYEVLLITSLAINTPQVISRIPLQLILIDLAKGKKEVTAENAPKPVQMTEQDWLLRFLFLETIAGVPGMVGGMLRHLRSLRRVEKEGRWIETLLEEAENERMHLMTFMAIKKPRLFNRLMIVGAQGVFCNAFFFSYLMYLILYAKWLTIVPLVLVIDSWDIWRKKQSLHTVVVWRICTLVFFPNGPIPTSPSQILRRITGIFLKMSQWKTCCWPSEQMKRDIDM